MGSTAEDRAALLRILQYRCRLTPLTHIRSFFTNQHGCVHVIWVFQCRSINGCHHIFIYPYIYKLYLHYILYLHLHIIISQIILISSIFSYLCILMYPTIFTPAGSCHPAVLAPNIKVSFQNLYFSFPAGIQQFRAWAKNKKCFSTKGK